MRVETALTRVLTTPELGRMLRMPFWLAGYDMTVCRVDRPTLLREVEREEPDIVIVNALMAGLNPAELAAEIKGMRLTVSPVLMALFSGGMENEQARAEAAGVICLSGGEARCEALCDICRALTAGDRLRPDFASEDRVRAALDSLGLRLRTAGCRYAAEAIGLCARDQRLFGGMSTVVYPEIANRLGKSSAAVERLIRHAIESAWLTGDIETQYDYFGNTIDEARGKPTNSEFIARITEALRLEAEK